MGSEVDRGNPHCHMTGRLLPAVVLPSPCQACSQHSLLFPSLFQPQTNGFSWLQPPSHHFTAALIFVTVNPALIQIQLALYINVCAHRCVSERQRERRECNPSAGSSSIQESCYLSQVGGAVSAASLGGEGTVVTPA